MIDQNGMIKIIDFGFAQSCTNKERLKNICGTPEYMDPDLAARNHYLAHASDVWAMGVAIFVLLTGQYPFSAEFEADLFRKIR